MVFWGVPLGRVFRSAVNYVITTWQVLLNQCTLITQVVRETRFHAAGFFQLAVSRNLHFKAILAVRSRYCSLIPK
jgi:hypothetical protein